jgi:hypothetical protein
MAHRKRKSSVYKAQPWGTGEQTEYEVLVDEF